MQFVNQCTNRFVPATTLRLHQALHGFGQRIAAGVVGFKNPVERVVRQQPRFFLGQNGEQRIEFQLVEMLAHQLETKAVKRADGRAVEQRQLLFEMRVIRLAD